MKTNTWNATLYDHAHSFVTKLGSGVVDLLDPQPGESILDLGCGTGHLTAEIAAKGAHVVGVDASVPMLEVARQEHPELTCMEGDARSFDLNQQFDAVFTNATLHWIKEQDQVAKNVARHLIPRGRFVGEFGGQGNVAHLHRALHCAAVDLGLPEFRSVNVFPTVATWCGHLEAAGFEVRFASLFDRPTPLDGPNGVRVWLDQFCAFYLDELDSTQREQVLAEAQRRVEGKLHTEKGWFADYRRLRFVAVKVES